MEFDYESLPIGSIATSKKGSRYVKSKSGWHPEGRLRFYNRGETPPSYPYDPIVRVDPVINADTANRLSKLHRSKPYLPKWNQEKFFSAFESFGWAESDLYYSGRVNQRASYRRKYTLTAEGGSRLNAYQAAKSTAQEGGDQ